MRLLGEQAERNLEDAHKRLSQKESELMNTQSQIRLTEDKVVGLAHYPEEVIKLKSTISSLDREKDVLQMDMDEKTERLVQLEEELLLKVSQVQVWPWTCDMELLTTRNPWGRPWSDHPLL